MSKKDFDSYYSQICDQYTEMKQLLDQIDIQSQDQVVSPEQLDFIKDYTQKIKDNYMIMSYVAHLLNKPNRKRKVKKYEKQNKKFLNSLDQSKSLQSIYNYNEQQLDNLGAVLDE